MIDNIHEDEFELNRKGQLTRHQIYTLLRWLLGGLLTTTLPGLLIAIGLRNFIGLIIGVAISIPSVIAVWKCGMDLWEGKPISLFSQVKKERARVRGPTNYYLLLSDRHGIEYRMQSSKEQWLEIQEGAIYQMFFTKRTKWLLSYKLLHKRRP